jgi:hypothetical protein
MHSSSEKEENINDAVANLMCLPVAEKEEKVSCVVKVSELRVYTIFSVLIFSPLSCIPLTSQSFSLESKIGSIWR